MTLTSQQFVKGTVIREPVGTGKGYWVGAPGAYYDAEEKKFYLTYRIRRPRGVQPDRGGVARIARSSDGIHFDDIFEVCKDAFGSTSIERTAVRRGPDGLWHYYPSFVDPTDNKWCTAEMVADRPEAFDPSKTCKFLIARDLDLEGVKDPWIMQHQGKFVMVLSIAVATGTTSETSHRTADIYNTGQCVSATGIAVSKDLKKWTWQGTVFTPEGPGWDGYARRINSIVTSGGRFVGFYDGSRGFEQNYEEQTGFCESKDLKAWRTLSPDSPALVSPHASGSLRYMDALTVGDDVYLYYEFVRQDGSHDLRALKMKSKDLSF